LKGGTLLVLQVQLQDAFKAEATTQVERIKEELNRQGIHSARSRSTTSRRRCTTPSRRRSR
jgi:preprotein translocase subunit SecD